MKRIVLFIILVCCPYLAFGQDSINPYNIQQSCNIELHNTDVYYNPFDPPSIHDTRAALCNLSQVLLDSNGLYEHWPPYEPTVYDTGAHKDTLLQYWQPHGTPLGQLVSWQRLFQAKRKPNGATSDIIAGGNRGDRVIISKNEDVDFRASGTIKLKSGFHVMPGAFFHAYTEPKWDTTVFSDEFNDSATFYRQWHVSNGRGSNYYPEGAQCEYDTNVKLVTDMDAHDGYALDIALREDTIRGYSSLNVGVGDTGGCADVPSGDTTPVHYIFSSGMIHSCPFPFTQRDTSPLVSAYPHAPYGKYEIREKIPHVQHHTNNWGIGSAYGFEYDMNETDGGNMAVLNPNFGHRLRFGPCNGVFNTRGSTVIFTSSTPQWCPSNNPNCIIINNVPYAVQLDTDRNMNTVMANPYDVTAFTGWPSPLPGPTDSVSFYYTINPNCVADSLHWRVDTNKNGKWVVFTGAYHDSAGTLLHFTKTNQPNTITLIDTIFNDTVTYNCHWDSSLNYPNDSGKILLDTPGVAPSALHGNISTYSYNISKSWSPSGYPVAEVPFDTTTYKYHTFAMEFLPHEVRFLYDSVVVRRLPDRLIPIGSPYYDWITTTARSPVDIQPAEIDIDFNTDPLGMDAGSVTYNERRYFEHAAAASSWLGFKDHAAHHLIDYIKVWDVPADVKVPNLPTLSFVH